MCYKYKTCTYIEKRAINETINNCKNCKYLNKFKRQAFLGKVGLVISIITFIITTSLLY